MVVLVAALTALSNSITHGLPEQISTSQVVFFKSTTGLLIIIFLNARKLGGLYKTKIIKWHAFKGLMGLFGNIMWVMALRHIPIAKASGLSMTSALITALGGWLFFQETFRKPVLWCLLLGFIGTMVIINPFDYIFNIYTIFPLVSATAFSASALTIKVLAKNDSSRTTLFYLLFFMSIFSVPSTIINWVSIDFSEILTLCTIGILFSFSQLCLIQAYTIAEASFIASFKYVRFPMNIFAGLLFFSEIPSFLTILGGVMIISASSYLIIVERSKKLKKINT
jgi:drug/metabolite transporter (DMT)-like permease